MPMPAQDIESMIQSAIPDAQVQITDLAGDGDHYAARVVSESFRGVSRVERTRRVYAALGGRMGGDLHALQLTTDVPAGG
jgi:stress-induced morphogen